MSLTRRRSTRAAFTLLEVLLTLSMSVVLMVLVGGAIQFYARDMNVRDMDIRQTQLASAVMQMIEDDLRATLHTEPVDTSALEALLLASSQQASGGGGGGAEGEDLSAAGIDSEDDTMIAETSTVDLASGAAVLETPGLIGNQYQIQIDLSRLPRLEEYVAMLDDVTTDIDDVPSDLKTVAYFVQPAGTIGGVQDPLNALDPDAAAGGTGGLVRRSLDRAATVQAVENGNLMMLNQTGQLLAPEITGIEFSYWDGLNWELEWSSDIYGELPLAVQVRIYMHDPAASQDSTSLGSTSLGSTSLGSTSLGSTSLGSTSLGSSPLLSGPSGRVFSHIVRLPLAQPIESEEENLDGVGL